MSDRVYRTLVRGRLKQLSSLLVGGSAPGPGDPDVVCARDGQGRLTIPGTALAGCLIETAGRVFPDLFRRDGDGKKAQRSWERITGKSGEWGPKKRTSPPDEGTLQSLWRIWPAHRLGHWSELRQGVGIRRATGATAAEGRALFDLETLPPGEEWDLFLEIDTRRCPAVEAVALHALREWAEGRCWLGAGPARGLGWMQLANFEILRLPCTDDAIGAWPDTRRPVRDLWPALAALAGEERYLCGEKALSVGLGTLSLPPDRFGYVVVKGHVVAGETAGYGLDALSVGGHAAGLLQPLGEPLALPRGATPASYLAGYAPDTPVVTSGVAPDAQRPFVPGSGLRGPLRHAAARWQGRSADPNVDGDQDRGKRDEDTTTDPVARLFGLTSRSSRLLLSDARLTDGGEFLLACLQHHAEDEFAASVFGPGKFDRTAVLKGQFDFRFAVEAARPKEEMKGYVDALLPALRLAELGFVPLGGAKKRGAGWLRWRFTKVEYGRAGGPMTPVPVDDDKIVPVLRDVAKKFAEGKV